MSLRVTNSNVIAQVIYDINKNLKSYQDLQLKLATGYKINKPSDDPAGIINVIKLKNSISKSDQHYKNMNEGSARMTAISTSLSKVEDLLMNIQVLAKEVLGSPTSSERPVIAQEINGLLEEIFFNANSTYLGKYVFGGQESLIQPFQGVYSPSGNLVSVQRSQITDTGGNVIKGIDGIVKLTLEDGRDIQVNISGSRPFMPNGEGQANDIFNVLIQLRDNIASNNISGTKALMPELESEFKNVLIQSTIIGERLRSIDNAKTANEQYKGKKQIDLSEILDLDYAKAISDLNYQQFILQSSMQVGAKIISPSLLDYI